MRLESKNCFVAMQLLATSSIHSAAAGLAKERMRAMMRFRCSRLVTPSSPSRSCTSSSSSSAPSTECRANAERTSSSANFSRRSHRCTSSTVQSDTLSGNANGRAVSLAMPSLCPPEGNAVVIGGSSSGSGASIRPVLRRVSMKRLNSSWPSRKRCSRLSGLLSSRNLSRT